MNNLEEIFSKHLINLIPEIHRVVCSDLIKDKSRNINQVPPLPYWLKCYRNSKSIFYISVLNMLSTTDNASLFLEQISFNLLPQKEKKILVNDAIAEINSHSEDEKRKFERARGQVFR